MIEVKRNLWSRIVLEHQATANKNFYHWSAFCIQPYATYLDISEIVRQHQQIFNLNNTRSIYWCCGCEWFTTLCTLNNLSNWIELKFLDGVLFFHRIFFDIEHTKTKRMGEELPILKGILKGNFSYHNARKWFSPANIKYERIFFIFLFLCFNTLKILTS